MEENPDFEVVKRGRKLGKYILSLEVVHTDGTTGERRRIANGDSKKEVIVYAHQIMKEKFAAFKNEVDGTFLDAPVKEVPPKAKKEKD